MPTLITALLLCLQVIPASPPRLRVDIVFTGLPMRPRFEAAAMKEVTDIWGAYSVDVQTVHPNDPGRADAVRLSVALTDHPDRQVATDALGSILFLDESPEPAIVMYPDAIAALVSSSRVSDHLVGDWPYALRDIVHGRALGRALAHEIGHFLLRSREHSSVGLMRARQSVFDLISTERKGFTLSADEATRLCPRRRRRFAGQ